MVVLLRYLNPCAHTATTRAATTRGYGDEARANVRIHEGKGQNTTSPTMIHPHWNTQISIVKSLYCFPLVYSLISPWFIH